MLSISGLALASALITPAVSKPFAQHGWNPWQGNNPSPSPSSPSGPECSNTYAPLAPPYLADLASEAGIYFGSATDQPGTGEDTNYVYQLILNDTRIFNQLTPTNYMKWFATEPTQNEFNYTGGNIGVSIARDHNKLLRCHNLVWVNQLPDWLVNGTWTRDELISVMENHITNLVTEWADVCYAWDVVNEAIFGNGTFAPSVFYDVIGEEYFYLAFQFAQAAVEATGKDIKLYYNDYGIENPGNKSGALINTIVPEMQRRGIRIDGIGLESHFTVGMTPNYTAQTEVIAQYAALGLEVAYTELDIRFEDAASARTNASGLALQAKNYYDTVKACVDSDACVGVTLWDYYDYYSWIPTWPDFEGEGAATPYWEDFTRKPAYYSIAEALQGVECTVCG